MKMYIAGEWVSSSNGKEIEKYNPSTGKVLEKLPAGTKEDVDRAIDSAEESWEKWYELGSVARSKVLFRTRELIEKGRKDLEDILVKENGKVTLQAAEEVDGVIDQIQYYAEFARKITGDIVEGNTGENKIFQYKVPYGVVVALAPWNFPAGMVARKLAPALLTGNSVVLKPSTDTPMSAEWLVKKFVEAGTPKGVLNFVTGKGSEIGDHLVSHPKVSLVTLTGSTATGQRIMEKASGNMSKLILELGGKAPFMVWKDANVENALKALIWAKFWNAGQSCIAAERLYIHEAIYESFLKKFVEATRKLKVGDPTSSDVGPLINKKALDTAESFVEGSISSGAKMLAGGKKPALGDNFRDGYFYEPTVIDGADQDSDLFQEEIFGPVIGAARVSSPDEMIEKANDSKYGLASYLFTNDPRLIFSASERVRFGELYVNMPGPESTQGYHTGFRLTGQAGEGSKHGIEEYLKLKNVYVDYSGSELRIPTVREDLLQR